MDEDEHNDYRMKIALRLENLKELQADLEKWRNGPWEEWARDERPIRKSISLYNNLFRLHNTMHGGVTSAPPELVWGIGIARWKVGGRQIDVPVIEQLVDLDVHTGGTLTIRPREVEPVFSLRPFLEADIEGSSEAQTFLKDRFALLVGSEDVEVSPFDPTVWENLLDAAAARLPAASNC